ncbi:Multi-component phenol hydoxylase, activator subunit; LapM [Azotobacter vinelandii CA]|uniref:Multi-component phenol hydoxylase, activator subunit LapM n=2 Tax=Azotobacter vinelandii TaxID=354 RepID=C1DN72_AZOVD|nr:MmoB/DmpM family protein [Azotobacter vinelandii]ACO79239.1 Multi-component phenol hydoxylase, activator subunit; LapM [Azotobacter vinelandii DJ]AGK13661.1 Multi-component phenol hydoxylase, activator subunit; LapM [Azotobacter vinelandii CA]AGK18186.1 Multi-component phenol hydoxylase, activator subunit; LapM [Azotobacter vinelandii CA6]WKN20206.1 MmoB/DmpM family protein [Azotobacter vinelandii]SFX96256.1 phenol 2-monooxygenase P2 subunit [Azotobacter vinelandii]
MSTVFIALQANEETRPIIEAIASDNPLALVHREPAMVKIDAPNRLVIRKESIEERIGRRYDLQELQINLITLSGNVDEDDDSLTLTWND